MMWVKDKHDLYHKWEERRENSEEGEKKLKFFITKNQAVKK